MTSLIDIVSFPSRREEAWKYTPVDEIVASLRDAVAGAAPPVSPSTVDELAGDLGCPRLVFVNGVFVPDASDCVLPDGVILDLTPGKRQRREDVDGFRALNNAAPTDTANLVVRADVAVPEAIHLVHLSAPSDLRTVSHPRTVVDVGEGARVALVETYGGLPGPAFTNASTTIRAGREAAVDHVRIQSEGDETVHVGHTLVEQGAASTTRLTSVMIGADIARHALDVRLAGPDAGADLDGLYLPARRQRHDNVVTVDHTASGGRSAQRYLGVVDDHGRGSFSGHVIVRAGTVGNDATQVNRNLVLTKTAEADTRPWLEIFADDVRCTHGATVGRLDDDALFYLRSRGIPVAVGRAMLIDAFIREIVDDITDAALRSHLANVMAAR